MSYKSLDLMASVKSLLNIGSGLFLWMVLWSLYQNFDWFWRVLLKSWFFTLGLILLICYWEMFTGDHLQGNFLFKLRGFPSYHIIQSVPVATFDNPNYLSLYLTLSLAFVFYFKKFLSKEITLFFTVSSILIILTTDSKLSLIALFVIVLFFIIYNRDDIKDWIAKRIRRVIFGGVISVVFLFGVFNSESSSLKIQENTIDLSEYLSRVETGNSYNVRKNLIFNGLYFLEFSNYLGIGPGQYSVHTSKGLIKHEVGTVLNPHSLFLELLSEYGIIIFIFFGIILIFLLIKAVLFLKLMPHFKNHFLYLFLTLLFIYPILSNNNSSFLNYPLNWFILSFIMLLHQELVVLKNEKDSRINNS
ncbi:MAG: O-antigen ligase family protein [Vicingaceae bacterium]